MRKPAGRYGVKLFAWALLGLALALSAVAHAATDITGQFAITRSGLVLNRFTNTFDSTVTLRNTSSGAVPAPIILVVGALPANVALANKAGQTSDGKPYVSPAVPGGSLAVGASLTMLLKYANPQRVVFPSTLQVLNGIDLPLDAPSLMAVVATGETNAFLIGRVVGASNLPITLQATTSASCVAGALAGGAPVGNPVPAMTDAAGYFAVTVAGVNPGAFVAINVVSPTVTAMSACLVSSRDNDSWPKAFPLDDSPIAQDLIDAPGKARWYKVNVIPGQQIEVKLSGLAADYDLAVFKDIGQVFAAQFKPASATTSDLLKLTAEYAPSVFSPSVFSPSVFSPSVFSPSVFSPSVFSPSVFSPSVFSPSVFSPSVFSPSVFSPSVFSPSVFSPSVFSPSVFSSQELAEAFSTAQTRSVISVAATPGTSDETTTVNTWNNTGSFYVRVVGHNGAFDTSRPFTLTVTKGATTCAGVTDTAISTRAPVAASALQTIVVADSSRTALDASLNLPGGGTLRDKLAAFAKRTDIAGIVVDVASDARVQALKSQAANNPACPFAKNLVAQEIKTIVDAYRANPLRYIVIVGNDDAIPFFRTPDESGLGEESAYVPPVESNSPSEASLRLDYVLSQDGYGSATSLSLRTYDFPVPGLAVGRLVEAPLEIAGLLDAYTNANGVVSPKSSLVTGYDFLADDAAAVRDELQQGTGTTPATLITPNGVSPQDPSSWTADQLRGALFGAHHDVIFLAGHFSANSALAADFSTSVLTTELVASTIDFTNSIVFSAGCHSGYNLVDSDAIAGVTQPLDWAQAFARKGATLVAGTGYQYGDTDFLEYSERIYDNFARQLRAGTGNVSIGEALVKAKRDYLAVTPDIRGLHEKALLEATLFGLPMLGVNMPGGRGATSGTSPVINATAVTTGPALSLGMKSFDLAIAPALTSNSQTLNNEQTGASVVATWQSGPDGVVTRPGEPALPLVAVNVTPTDAKVVLRGIGFRGGSYGDVSPMFPFSGAPTTELRGVHVPFVSPTFYPARLFTPNYFDALSAAGGTTLLVTPVQHRVASVADGTSTERTFGNLNLRLFYSGNLSQAALSDAPSIIAVDAKPDATGIAFTAQVVGDPAAGIQQVWVTYTSDGSAAWTPLDLTQCVAPLVADCAGIEDSRVWKGHLAATPTNLAYIVQAVSAVGLVALDDNRGAYYGVVTGPPAVTTFTLDPLPSTAAFGETLSISGTLSAGGAPVAGKFVTINVGGTTQIGITDSAGRVTVQVPALAVTGNLQVSASFGGDQATAQSSMSAPLTVTQAPTNLAPQTLGGALTGVLAGANVPLAQQSVAFAVDGPGGPRTIFAITDYLGRAALPPPGLPAGQYTVTQMSFPGNATYAATSVALAQQFTVPKTAQAITFAALADRTEGEADFAVYANASSGLPVSFSGAGECTMTGNSVHLASAGSCTITASQAGDANFDAASPVARAFTIAPNGNADQVIAFGIAPSNVHVGDAPLAITATSTSPTAPPSGIAIVFSSLTASTCTASGTNGATLTAVASGTCTIAANEAGDASYNAAPQVTLSFTIVGAGPSAQFAATGDMLAARSDHTATLLEDGRVLVAGGFGTGGAMLDTSELYCPDNASEPPTFAVCPAGQRGAFTATLTHLPAVAAGQTATRLHDGTVVLIGGGGPNLQRFDAATGTWEALGGDTRLDRAFHTATLLANGGIFVAGGVDSQGQTLASTFVLDMSTTPPMLLTTPDLAFARESHTATLLPDGTVLIAGGRRKLAVDFSVVGEYELYDPSVAGPLGNGAISDEGAMSRGRFWHAAEIAGLRVLLTGGSCDPASAVSNALTSTEFFSFSTGPEPPVACDAPAGPSDLVQARRAFTMTPLPDSTLVAIGGADASGVSRSTSEIFAAGATTFQLGPSLATARAEHQATLLLDGRVLVTGGVATGGAPLASAEIFTAAAGAAMANQRPTANAGTSQSVLVGATVQLTSAGSIDPEGRTLTWFWTLTSKPTGSTAQLSSAISSNPTFVADKAGAYVVQLIVNDGGVPPLDSVPASVQITAGSANQAPVAVGDSYSVAQDATLVVGAANGVLANDTDADGNALTAALDTNVAHGTLTLNTNGGFTYTPAAGYSGGDSFSYHANDGTSDSNVATVSLTVNAVAINHAPVANAGSAQSATVGQPVQLNGTCTDVDGDATTAAWSFTSKPATSVTTLSSASVLNPTFTPDVAGSYTLQLVCNDGKVDSAPSTVTIGAAASATIALALVNAGSVPFGHTADVAITLSSPAPAGGISVALSSDDGAVLSTATPTVTIAASQTQATGSVTGVTPGSTTLRASASGFTQGTLGVTVADSITVLGPVNVPVGASVPLPILVSPPAPPGGLLITLTTGDTNVATLASTTIAIAAGGTSGNAIVNGVGTGTTSVTAQAPGYAPASSSVTAVSTTPVQWTVASGGNGHWYQFVFTQNGYTWDDARGTANNATFLGMPGYLATVTSQAENDFLYALAKYPAGAIGTLFDPANPGVSLGTASIAGLDALTWLGGADAAAEGTWRWINGPETGTVFWTGGASGSTPAGGFAFWSSGQPDSFTSSENVLQIRYAGGRWNDSGTGFPQALEITNPDGTKVRAPVGYVIEYSPPAAPVTTYTVTNLNDNGVGSLREAVIQANQAPGPATIVFAPGLTGTMTLTSGQMQISGPMTIVGPGADKLTIDGNANGRIFSIFATDPACPAIDGPDYLVSLAGVTLTNARNTFANTGGAIFTEHSLALDAVVVQNSASRQGAGIGVLVQYPGQSLTITNSQFVNNLAMPIAVTGVTALSSQNGAGLAIIERCAVSGVRPVRTTPVTATITGSVFSGNRAQPATLSGTGGAIESFSSADITITDSRIVDNHVDAPNPPIAGQVYRGAGVYGNANSLRIVRTEIADNSVIDATASDLSRGGGIAVFNNAAELQAPPSTMAVQIIDSTISGNGVPATAGAIWVLGNIAVEIDNSTIANNAAGAGRTGGILMTSGATSPAGSVSAANPTLKLVSTILARSAATTVDISTNTSFIPSFTIDAASSLVGTLCSTCNISLGGTGNLVGVDPLLSPLAFNGGPTRTHALLAGSPAIDAGSNPLGLATDQRGAGFARVAGAAADMGAFEAGSNVITLTLSSSLAGIGQTVNGTITLGTAAPVGGTQVALSSSATGVATVAPASVTIAQGQTTGSFSVTGVALGNATMTASASGFTSGSVDITVTSNVITLGNVTMGPGATQGFPVTLSQAAPAGGLTIALSSSDTGVVTVPASVFIPAGGTFASPNPTATAQGIGTTTLLATAPGYAPGSAAAKVALTGTLTPNPISVVQNATGKLTLTLSQVAPASGLTVNLATDNTAIATVPPTITVAQGNLSDEVPVAGVAPGTTTVRASGAGLTETTATVNVTSAPPINISTLTNLGKDLERPIGLSLGAPAPAGNLSVTVTSSDPSKLLLSTSPATAGSASVSVTIFAGNSSSSTTVYAQALASSGSVQITASAPGYANGAGSVGFAPSGFVNSYPGGNFSLTTLAPDQLLYVCAASLDPATLNVYTQDALRTSASVGVSSSNIAVGTIVNSPRTLTAGQTCTYETGTNLFFHAVGTGSATLTVIQPSGFSTPSNRLPITATVTATGIVVNDVLNLGKDLQRSVSWGLQVPATAAGGVDVTLTSSDASKLLLSADPALGGSASVTVHVGQNQNAVAVYAQALASSGSVQITASASGYVNGAGSVGFAPSGFVNSYPGGDFSITTLASDQLLYVCAASLDPATLNYYTTDAVRTSASVGVSSSNTAVGTIVNSPRTLTVGQTCTYETGTNLFFHAVGTGSATLTVVQPSGFSTPSNRPPITATVTATGIVVNDVLNLGKDLQRSVSWGLQVPATAAGGVDVTLTSSDASKLLLSADPALGGSASVTVHVGQNQNAVAVYAQALASSGSVQITASASGYVNGAGSVGFAPSGFVNSYPGGDFSITTLASDQLLYVCAASLDPATLNYYTTDAVRTSASVGVSSSNTAVGTIVNSPRTLTVGQTCTYETGTNLFFHAVGTGSATLTVVQPSGFSTPSNRPPITATVTATGIVVNDVLNLGKDLQRSVSWGLQVPATAAGGVDVTLTSSDASKLLLSADPALGGSASVTVHVGQNQNAVAVYAQALASSGSVQITASASGYVNGAGSVGFAPSGFVNSYPGGDFSITTLASDQLLYVCAASLDPATLNYYTTDAVRTSASVGVSSSNTAVGTIVNSPRTLTVGQTCTYETGTNLFFHPVDAGASTLTVVQPSGFSTPSNRPPITATVN